MKENKHAMRCIKQVGFDVFKFKHQSWFQIGKLILEYTDKGFWEILMCDLSQEHYSQNIIQVVIYAELMMRNG